jgi:serine/threonine protein kinase
MCYCSTSITHLLELATVCLCLRFGPLSDEKSSHYTRQIVQGLEYLHSKNITHRNVRAAKVMVTPKDVAKLIDLWSLKIELSPGVGPNVEPFVHWLAPEVINPGHHTKKLDIWSLGCTVHEMATSYPPW